MFVNIAANFIGQSVQAVVLFASMPIFLHYLGPEAFGLIGIYTLLQAWFNFLDLGISPMLARVFAQDTGENAYAEFKRDILRSAEIILILLIIPILALACFFGSVIGMNLLENSTLQLGEKSNIVILFSLMIASRFFESIYKSVLVGKQCHILLNGILSFISVLRAALSIAVMIYIASDVVTFFIIQSSFGILLTTVLGFSCYKKMRGDFFKAKFSVVALKKVYLFSFGLALVTISSLGLTHFDKVILSSLLSLEDFGYFTFASSSAAILHLLITPIVIFIGPKLAHLQKLEIEHELGKIFIFGCEAIALLVCSVGGVLCIFAHEILLIWTRDLNVADSTYIIFSILVLGNIINSMMWVPFQAQVAFEWSSLALITNTISILLLVPLNLYFIPAYGGVASSTIWLVLNLGYVSIGAGYMFSKILGTYKTDWYSGCVIKPFIIGIVIPLAYKLCFGLEGSDYLKILQLLVVLFFSAFLILVFSNNLKIESKKIWGELKW